MSALRLARGHTGRTKILKFEGCYHGTADSLLVKAGSGALAFGTPSSAGVPADLAQHTLVAQFNDLDSVQVLFDQHGPDIACVMVEPYAGNMNLIKPAAGFHQGLREICTKYGTLLIFDEVMTGFRVALGGAQELLGVTPDMTAFGKVIGGGMPVGAIGGPASVMDKMAPLGPVYQAGTLSGNPIAMAAGIATLDLISAPGFYDALGGKCAQLVAGLNQLASETGVAMCAQSTGSMGGIFFLPEPARSYAEVMRQDVESFKKFYHHLLEAGVYLPPSPVEAFFFSAAHGDEQIAQTLQAARDALRAL
jgi:glutamate-1-semialdehyde 2,1-aminomutase